MATLTQRSIDGDTAKWVSDYSGAKASSTSVGFVPLSGTAQDNDGFEYVESDRFFDDDGCYDFTLEVTNVNLGDEHSTTFTVPIRGRSTGTQMHQKVATNTPFVER